MTKTEKDARLEEANRYLRWNWLARAWVCRICGRECVPSKAEAHMRLEHDAEPAA